MRTIKVINKKGILLFDEKTDSNNLVLENSILTEIKSNYEDYIRFFSIDDSTIYSVSNITFKTLVERNLIEII